MRRAFAAALAVAVGGLVLACEPALAKRSPYASKLAALCTETRKAIERIPSPKTSRQLDRTTARVNEAGRRFVLGLAKLRPSAAERSRATLMGRLYASYWAGQLQAYVLLHEGVSQPNQGLLQLYRRTLLQLGPFQVRAEKLAARLGARECTRQPVRE